MNIYILIDAESLGQESIIGAWANSELARQAREEYCKKNGVPISFVEINTVELNEDASPEPRVKLFYTASDNFGESEARAISACRLLKMAENNRIIKNVFISDHDEKDARLLCRI